MYLGYLECTVDVKDRYLAKILLLAAKKAITKNWLKTETPGKKQWVAIVEDIMEMENFTYKLKLKEERFLKDWGKWINVQQQQQKKKDRAE